MGLSVIHGRILIQYGKGGKFRDYIKSIGEDGYYPFISTKMFSYGADSRPQFYDQEVIAFAATYKNVEYGYGFHVFILKFEKILRQLEFDTAHIELETELIGTYRVFWKAIRENNTIKDQYLKEDFQLIRTNEWYFGFGYRNDYGSLNVPLEEEHIFSYDDFEYPVKIPEHTISRLKPLIEGINDRDIGLKFYVKEYLQNQWDHAEELYFYLSKLQIEGKVDFKYEGKNGYSIIRLK